MRRRNWGSISVFETSQVYNNAAHRNGGGIYSYGGSVSVSGQSQIHSNGVLLDGGGIFSDGSSVSVSGNSVVRNNIAAYSGGGIYNHYGSVDVSSGVVMHNHALQRNGGGIASVGRAVTIQTGGAILENSAEQDGGGIWSSGSHVDVSGLVMLNTARRHGGGIYVDSGGLLTDVLVVSSPQISRNQATGSDSRGGGVYFTGGGEATIVATTIDQNEAISGGGLFVDHGTLDLVASTISRNSVLNHGGGIYVNSSANLSMLNSTISGNSAASATSMGGGILNAGLLKSTNNTITDNQSGYAAGGIYNTLNGSSAELYNTIVAGNFSMFYTFYSPDDYWAGPATTSTHNIYGTYRGVMGAGNIQDYSATLWLEPLADNGGPTKTHALKSWATAINAGNNDHFFAALDDVDSLNADLIFLDQRGHTRMHWNIDIGAVEWS